MKRALTSTHIPSRLEPWLHGSHVVCLCGMQPVQTLLLLHTKPMQPKDLRKLLQQLKRRSRSVAAFHQVHWFPPIAIETMGVVGPKSMALLKNVGHSIVVETGDPRARDYLFQRLSVAGCTVRGLCLCPGNNHHLILFSMIYFIFIFFMYLFTYYSFIGLLAVCLPIDVIIYLFN